MFDVVPLGTGSAIPTRHRGLSATAVWRDGRLFLFDCGEGTQFRLLDAGLNRSRLDAVFVTHFHGDHLYGLPGMITTLALLERTRPLTVVGPAGIEGIVRGVPGLSRDWLPFDIRWVELEEGVEHAVVYEGDGLTVEARPLDHRVFAVGYRLEEAPRPGRLDAEAARAAGVTEGPHFAALKRGEPVTLAYGTVVQPEGLVGPERPGASFAYCLDTAPCDGARRLAEGATLLLHEATFAEALREQAAQTGHSTARDAATTARDAGAERLLLTHFSARYPDPSPLVEEARAVFPNTDAAEELRRYAVTRDAA
ncbi:MAG: ribonuclease Z [Rubricoccaceae bacterium]|nr:ribonuclease Z [Rubricoccaceae bacterium]